MPKGTPLPTCTVQLANSRFCDAPAHPDMPFPICARHAAQVWRRVNEMTRVVETNAEITGAPIPASSGRKDRVYYVQVGPLVKIGTTNNLTGRLRAYPPNRKLLAIEDGGRTLELRRHRQFAALLAGGKEWFRPDATLLTHINKLRATQDAPELALTA